MTHETDDQQWQARAACRDQDPELFFPDPSDDQTRAIAESICVTCPVQIPCMATANHNREKHGVWAGFERTDKGRPKLPHGPMPKGGYRIGRTTR
ncbi:WhiB family transcriptional regulator [Mycolicibacterium boenickei]|nr:WhiB family transcriptional regulator [Mycolicibacterium boenickei]